MINIVVAFTQKTFGIGKDNSIPWYIPDDLKHFKNVTDNGVVVVGRKTWDSIPLKNKPLKNRHTIVLTNTPENQIQYDNVEYVSDDQLNNKVRGLSQQNKNIYIIGGTYLYRKYMGIAEKIYATVIEDEYDCDTFFPIENFCKYRISSVDKKNRYYHITYEKTTESHDEYRYIYLLDEICYNGYIRPDRTGVGTSSVFGKQIRFDISKSIPILTTKFVPWKLVIKELLWFLQGKTDSKILEKQGVNIWKGNTTRDFLDNRGLTDYEEGDIGPMYGFNWRHYNAEYKGCTHDYENQGYDQLVNLIDGLKNDPFSRRHMITTFNPCVVDQSVLAPCHGIVVQFYVDTDQRVDITNTIDVQNKNKFLSCHMYQRSSDTALGLVINIASYAILTNIIAKLCDMQPKELIISIGDAHVYLNHLEPIKEQLYRHPLPFPILNIKDEITNKNINDITLDDFEILGYLHYPSIKLPMAI